MTSEKLLDLFGDIREEYLEEAIASREGTAQSRRGRKYLLLIAAAGLAALLVGCGIVYVLSLQDLKLGDKQTTRPRWDEASGAVVYETVSYPVLTFSGLKGTPNYEAAREWYTYQMSCRSQLDTAWEVPDQYQGYGISSPEMAEKLEELAETYHLKLMGEPVEAVHPEALLSYLGIEDFFCQEEKVSWECFDASYYAGGWFHCDLRVTMEESEAWPYSFLCSIYYAPKDCLDLSAWEIYATTDWREWNRTAASGEAVLVLSADSASDSWVFCDREDAAISLQIQTTLDWYTSDGTEQMVMPQEQLAAFVDGVDFSLRPNPGDPALLQPPEAGKTGGQTRKGYRVEAKEVFTDGYEIWMTLGITAPEDVDLEQYLQRETSLRFGTQQLLLPEGVSGRVSSITCQAREDGDGRKNTVDYCVHMSAYPQEAAFLEGLEYSLYLRDLQAKRWDPQRMQEETLWKTEAEWSIAIPMENGDWRELEFLKEPIFTQASRGPDIYGNEEFTDHMLTSIKLRALGGTFTHTLEEGIVQLADSKNQKYPKAVLQDGTTICLGGDLMILDSAYTQKGIPLEQVTCLILIDGTKLYPQEG